MTDMDNAIEATEESQALEEGQPEEVVTDAPTEQDAESTESEESSEEITTPKLAGKFDTPEELEKAYLESQKKISTQGQELSQARRSAPSQETNDVSRKEVQDEMPKDELDEMLSFYRDQKKQQQSEQVTQLDSEDFEEDATLHPHIKPYKAILLKLGRSPEFRATPFSEIWESIKDTFDAPLDDEQFKEDKRNASTIKGAGNAKNKGVKQWTKQSIQKLSAKEFAKHESDIVKFLSKDKN